MGTWVGPREEPARYECLEQVGGGAEGAVFRGRYVGPNGGTPTAAALKVYRRPSNAGPDWPDDGTWLDISDQVALLRNISESKRLVSIHEVFQGRVSAPGEPAADTADPAAFRTPVLVMEWLDGRSLTDELRAARAPLARRLTWISQLSEAVQLIHSVSRTYGNALVHTDIKPDNCMITASRGLVLVDTGAIHRATASHNRRGLRTPLYAAPEVLADPGRQPSFAADIYSLGAVAYYVLTGEAPPESSEPGYLSRARAQLNATDLGPGHSSGTRRLVANHVLALLDPDPAQRTRKPPSVWADQLTSLVVPRRRHRAAFATAGALVALGLAALGFLTQHQPSGQAGQHGATTSPVRTTGLPSGRTSTPAQNTEQIEQWGTLSPAPALGTLVFSSNFSHPAAGWPTSNTEAAVNRYADGGYVLHPLTNKTFDMVTAPSDVMTSAETVTATASFESGQGVWGIWCRGTNSQAAESYQFWISHAGAVSIVTPQGQTPWVYLEGIDVTQPTTLTGRCADENPGPVELILSVNGRQVVTQQVSADLLGPGFSGIETAGFSDVSGPVAQVRFTRYAIYKG